MSKYFYPSFGFCYLMGTEEEIGQKQLKKEVKRNTTGEKGISL